MEEVAEVVVEGGVGFPSLLESQIPCAFVFMVVRALTWGVVVFRREGICG